MKSFIPPPHFVLVPLAWGQLFKNSVLLRVICGEFNSVVRTNCGDPFYLRHQRAIFFYKIKRALEHAVATI